MTETTPELRLSGTKLEAAKNHYMAVGLVAGTWSSFELNLDTHALKLAQIPPDPGHCLTSQIIGSAKKLDAYMAIAKLRGAKKTISELEVFAKDTAAVMRSPPEGNYESYLCPHQRKM